MRYPLVKQHDLKDCGPCCLASIIIFYKGYLSVYTLSNMMHTTKNGTTAYDLIETAKKIGFDACGLKTNMESLVKEHFPLIAHVTIDRKYQHYVIIYKVKKDKILIGDTSSKIKYMSLYEFEKIWNNFIIRLAPLKPLPNIKEYPFHKYIFKIVRNNYKIFIWILIINVLFIVLSLIYTFFVKYIVDNILLININVMLLFILIILLKIICFFIKNKVQIKLNKRIGVCLTNDVINSVILLPYPYYRNHQTGEIVSIFSDLDNIKLFISNLITISLELPLFLIFLVIMYFTNSNLFLIILIILLLYFVFNIVILGKLKKVISIFQINKANFNSLLVENITGFETIKGLNKENKIIKKISNCYQILEDTIANYGSLYNNKEVLSELIKYIGIIIIICYGLFTNLKISSIVIFYYLYNYLLDPMSLIINVIIKYKEALNSYQRTESMHYKIKQENNEPSSYNILFDNLSFKMGYKEILSNINLKIKEGEKVFITGSSGSGKSTLVKLLKGYYSSSNLLLGNKNINTCCLNKILYISQNEFLFTDSLLNNLMCDDKNCEDIVKMCLVNQNKNMYIEENGFNLSGGEKERIILARSIIQNFKILIIDEGLSQIDINKERIILKNIFSKYKDMTIIVISHRLDNLDLYDHFIEISAGKIVKNDYKHFN